MVEFINKLTGTAMFVDDARVEEYKAAGHTLAAKPAPDKPVSTNKPRRKKKTEG